MSLAPISEATRKVALAYVDLINVDRIDAGEVIGTALATERNTIVEFLKRNVDRPIEDLIREIEEG